MAIRSLLRRSARIGALLIPFWHPNGAAALGDIPRGGGRAAESAAGGVLITEAMHKFFAALG